MKETCGTGECFCPPVFSTSKFLLVFTHNYLVCTHKRLMVIFYDQDALLELQDALRARLDHFAELKPTNRMLYHAGEALITHVAVL